jgi:hypothetical protein
VIVVDFLKNLPYSYLLEHHFLQIAYKRQGFYVRKAEFLPEVEVSSEIEIRKIKKANKDVMRLSVSDSNISAIIGQKDGNVSKAIFGFFLVTFKL